MGAEVASDGAEASPDPARKETPENDWGNLSGAYALSTAFGAGEHNGLSVANVRGTIPAMRYIYSFAGKKQRRFRMFMSRITPLAGLAQVQKSGSTGGEA